MATNYQRGADFERTVAKDIESHGYVTVRSAGSHSPADLLAARSTLLSALYGYSEVVAVQCKRDGRLDPDEWNEFWEWCRKGGAIPILASKGPRGSGIIYRRLTSRKDGRGRQPWESWTPQIEGSTDEVS